MEKEYITKEVFDISMSYIKDSLDNIKSSVKDIKGVEQNIQIITEKLKVVEEYFKSSIKEHNDTRLYVKEEILEIKKLNKELEFMIINNSKNIEKINTDKKWIIGIFSILWGLVIIWVSNWLKPGN